VVSWTAPRSKQLGDITVNGCDAPVRGGEVRAVLAGKVGKIGVGHLPVAHDTSVLRGPTPPVPGITMLPA
jgi:hypothetical protein